jgi:maleate isomerase
VHPPWFDAELAELGRAYLEAAGAEVVRSASAALPSDQRAITPDGLHDWVAAEAPPDAGAVVIGGNGFRAVGAIEAMEATLGIPVVTANQALLWALLRVAGADPSAVRGHGRLFRAG